MKGNTIILEIHPCSTEPWRHGRKDQPLTVGEALVQKSQQHSQVHQQSWSKNPTPTIHETNWEWPQQKYKLVWEPTFPSFFSGWLQPIFWGCFYSLPFSMGFLGVQGWEMVNFLNLEMPPGISSHRNGWRLRWLIHLRKWKNYGTLCGRYGRFFKVSTLAFRKAKELAEFPLIWADHNDFLIFRCCKYGFSGNCPYGRGNKCLDLRPIETMIM